MLVTLGGLQVVRKGWWHVRAVCTFMFVRATQTLSEWLVTNEGEGKDR